MSMLIKAISALGDNSGVCPLLVRDLGIEASFKVGQTYLQNKKESKVLAKHATRERFIDEYGASTIWAFGPLAVTKGFDKFIEKRGIPTTVDYNLVDTEKTSETILNNTIDIFKNNATKEVKEIELCKKNFELFKKMTAIKYAAAIIIPVISMGFILPKANFALTRYLMDKDAKKGLLPEKYLKNKPEENKKIKNEIKPTNKLDFNPRQQNKSNLSFKGFSSVMTSMSQQNMMAINDIGLAVGRVSTSRSKNEGIENAFRMAGVMFLSYVAPKKIEKGMNYLTSKIFKINTELSPDIMTNKNLQESIKNNNLELPKEEKNVLDFLDTKSNSVFSKISTEKGYVKYLKNGVRDPRKLVDTKKIFNLGEKINKFKNEALKAPDFNKYIKKAVFAKSVNTMANIGISSFLLAVALPQAQYLLRKIISGSAADPGLIK